MPLYAVFPEIHDRGDGARKDGDVQRMAVKNNYLAQPK